MGIVWGRDRAADQLDVQVLFDPEKGGKFW